MGHTNSTLMPSLVLRPSLPLQRLEQVFLLEGNRRVHIHPSYMVPCSRSAVR